MFMKFQNSSIQWSKVSNFMPMCKFATCPVTYLNLVPGLCFCQGLYCPWYHLESWHPAHQCQVQSHQHSLQGMGAHQVALHLYITKYCKKINLRFSDDIHTIHEKTNNLGFRPGSDTNQVLMR